MVKKLIILLVALGISVAVVVFGLLGAILPWFATRSDQPVTTVDDLGPTMTVISNFPTLTASIGNPANPAPTTTPVAELLNQTPICFTPEELLPFAFTPQADRLMVRASSGVQIFDLESGAQDAFIHSSQNVITAALAPDGNILAWALQDGSIQLVRLSDQKVPANLTGHPDPVYDLQFSPTGDRLFSASHDGLFRVWDLDGKLLESIEVGGEVLGIGLSWDGSKLATIPSDGPVSLWDLAGNTKITEIGGSGGYDTSDAHFSPDEQYLVADLATGIFLWRIPDASLV